MPSKRTLLDRHRKPLIDDETMALFVQLESMGLGSRNGDDEIRRLERQLHERLGICGEWFCSVVSVLDRRTESRRPGSPQDEDFRRVRAVRLQLLEEAARRGVVFVRGARRRRSPRGEPEPPAAA
ncbi:MAG: hypothetical protein JO312_26670 [Hyphomicrobiales bacterium]|nr:hypothetical protein [Hyphomicrobiales bacterium]